MKFGELRGTPLLGVEKAERLGAVDDLYLDLQDQRVVALRIKTGGIFSGHKALLLQNVKAIGHDAVTVDDAGAVKDPSDIPSLKDIAGWDAIDGGHVVTESGTDMGTVADVDLDVPSGVINGYILHGSLMDRLQHEEHMVPASTVKSIGHKTIVVADTVVPA